MKLSDMQAESPAQLLTTLKHGRGREPLAQRLADLGLPGNKTEHYRHFGIKTLLEKSYTPFTSQQCGFAWNKDHLRIRNGRVSAAPNGVEVAFEEHTDLDITHYDPLYFLGHLLCERYIVITVRRDMAIRLEHHLEGREMLFSYRIVINVDPGCRVSLYESFHADRADDALLLYGVDMHAGEGAALTWVRNQSAEAAGPAVIGSHRYDILSGARFRLHTFDFGSGTALHLYKNDLAERTDTRVTHLLFAADKARRGNVVKLRHNGRDGSSEHEAKAVLKGGSTGIFDGLIRVADEAKYTRARQNSKAILLNDRAFMAAKPQLEIYTDELEASHGSTIGRLDEAALFYLRSRGIADDEARKMLILAFAETMIGEVETATWADEIRAAFERAYYLNEKEIP